MKNYYEVNGQRRYYIAKRIDKKQNKENMFKVVLYCFIGWFIFYLSVFLFLHFLETIV
jgi:hypothetical protein